MSYWHLVLIETFFGDLSSASKCRKHSLSVAVISVCLLRYIICRYIDRSLFVLHVRLYCCLSVCLSARPFNSAIVLCVMTKVQCKKSVLQHIVSFHVVYL